MWPFSLFFGSSPEPNWADQGIVITPAMGWILLLHTTATFVGGFFVGKLFKRRSAANAGGADGGGGAASAGGWRRGSSTGGGRRKLRPASSLRQPGRTVAVVTTAALPWRTGEQRDAGSRRRRMGSSKKAMG